MILLAGDFARLFQNAQQMNTVLLIGDRSPAVIAHEAIPKAIALTGLPARAQWLATRDITSIDSVARCNAQAIWCVPGSPYDNMEGALLAIRFAREQGIPFLGTCGGFQHAVIEFARNVIGLRDADHAESNPNAEAAVIGKLVCPLVNQSEVIDLLAGTKLQTIYGTTQTTEAYQCSYGLNPAFVAQLRAGGMQFSASSADGGMRAFELPNHPFFIGTLFQPERSARRGEAHPLIREFLLAADKTK